MSKKIIYFLIIALTFSSFIGCKKTQNDPFFSSQSRNNRIIGKWILKESDISYNVTYSNNDTYYYAIYNDYFDGAILTETATANGEIEIVTNSYSEILEINEDGSYKITKSLNGIGSSISGIWTWMDTYKDKTGIKLETFNSEYIEYQKMLFYIEQLSKDKIVLKSDEVYTRTYPENNIENFDFSVYIYSKEK
jgi:hypothetical protein